MTIMTSREFNRDVSRAKREAQEGPVYITDRGTTSHVLLTYEAFRLMSPLEQHLADRLRMEDDVELELPPRTVWPDRDIEW